MILMSFGLRADTPSSPAILYLSGAN